MAIPVYLWLYDEKGALIKGQVEVFKREGSIEVIELMHSVQATSDPVTGKLTAKREHSGYAFEKETDRSSPYLYRALTTGRVFSKAIFKFYRINYSGQEEEYFRTTLENVRVADIDSFFSDVDKSDIHRNHHEYVDLSFEKITWLYLDGNISHSDSWNERSNI